jgi:sigma-B regulation protein RsbQ
LAQIMVALPPCYTNHGDGVGGFTRADIDDSARHDGQQLPGAGHSNMAPAIMGNADQPELGIELTNSFGRNDREIATFARVTFLSGHRAALPLHPRPR